VCYRLFSLREKFNAILSEVVHCVVLQPEAPTATLWASSRTRSRSCCVSLEFFPPKTDAGLANLMTRIRGMVSRLRPAFVSMTWRAQFKDEDLWLSIGTAVQRAFGVDVLLHLTCHLPVEDLRRILRRCREAGITNILALRGDPPLQGSERWRPVAGGLHHAVELVQLIRADHGDAFCVGVGGYPEVHTEAWNCPELPPSEQAAALDLARLKAKVDAGADFVITQVREQARVSQCVPSVLCS
jgi:methylenetetrahydrofolate reductase (NADPH)